MNIGGAFLTSVLLAVDWIFAGIWWLVMVWVVVSWILFFASQSSFSWRHRTAFNILNQLNDIFSRMTWPILRPFRRILPPHKTAGIDWSPLLLLGAIWFLRTFLQLAFRPILFR
jgi:uncharacterized protein YggT (Ycf19 family)